MSSPNFLSTVPGLLAANLTIDGLAVFCFNRQWEHKFWEVAYLRHDKHTLGIDITEVDARGKTNRIFPTVMVPENLLTFEISLTSGSEAHYDTFPQGGPASGDFNRNAPDNDPHDIRWMIDLAGPEPRHGRLIRLKPRSDERVGVTLARFHHSLFFTGKPSEKSVRFSPRRNGDPDGPGNFDLGPTNEEILGVLLATEPGEIRFDGLGIDPLPYDENRRYEIEIVNMDNQLAEKKHRFVKGDFHYFYDVIEVDGDQQELWAFPRATGRFTPDGDCNPEFVSLATLQPLIES
jgi:hypothetical protein